MELGFYFATWGEKVNGYRAWWDDPGVAEEYEG